MSANLDVVTWSLGVKNNVQLTLHNPEVGQERIFKLLKISFTHIHEEVVLGNLSTDELRERHLSIAECCLPIGAVSELAKEKDFSVIEKGVLRVNGSFHYAYCASEDEKTVLELKSRLTEQMQKETDADKKALIQKEIDNLEPVSFDDLED